MSEFTKEQMDRLIEGKKLFFSPEQLERERRETLWFLRDKLTVLENYNINGKFESKIQKVKEAIDELVKQGAGLSPAIKAVISASNEKYDDLPKGVVHAEMSYNKDLT